MNTCAADLLVTGLDFPLRLETALPLTATTWFYSLNQLYRCQIAVRGQPYQAAGL